MEGCTADRVAALAPDAASLKAGQGLAAPRKWVSVGNDGDVLWGECQGSGAKPYQVRVHWSEPAYKCSCPSRKFPCKHSLGLMLLAAAGSLPAATPPAWVTEWLTERTARAEKKREKADAPPKPVDEKAQQKRREDRLARVADGLASLKLWLHDLVRSGLAAAPSRGYGYFDEQARRLIDAQAPGVARRVQALAGIASGGAGWQRPFLEQLAQVATIVRGFERRDALSDAARDLLLNTIGLPRSQDEVLAGPPLADRWQIVAQTVALEDRLRVQTTWLLGRQTGERVRVLAFAHGAAPLDASLPPGFAFDGELVRFPGDVLRGLVKSRGDLTPLNDITPAVDLDTLADHYATLRAADPWLDGLVAPLTGVIPACAGDGWTIADGTGRRLAMIADNATAWTLMASPAAAQWTSSFSSTGAASAPSVRPRPTATSASRQPTRRPHDVRRPDQSRAGRHRPRARGHR